MRTRRPGLILAVMLAPSVAGASDHVFDMFAAPSYLNARGSSSHLGGWHVAGAWTTERWRKLSFIGDVSVHFLGDHESGADLTQVTLLTGPRWTFLGGDAHNKMPFVHLVVMGAVMQSKGAIGDAPASQSTAGAIALGGGIDITSGRTRRFGTRLQFDYIQPWDSDSIDKSFRVSLGFVYRLKLSAEKELELERRRKEKAQKP